MTAPTYFDTLLCDGPTFRQLKEAAADALAAQLIVRECRAWGIEPTADEIAAASPISWPVVLLPGVRRRGLTTKARTIK